MALTPKQEKFCLEVIAGKNQSDAYRAAYTEQKMSAEAIHVEACKLMQNPKIVKRVAELRAPAIAKAQVDAKWIMEKLMTVAERCMQEEAVKDREGNPTGEYVFNAAGANKAIELLAKHVDVRAFAADRHEVTGKDGGPIELAELSDAERAARLAALTATVKARKGV